MTSVGQPLARSLVEGLGPDCSVAARAAELLLSRPGHVIEVWEFRAAGISDADTGSLLRSLADFQRRGWCSSVGNGWSARAGAVPVTLPAFLEGAGAMLRCSGPPIRAEAVVTMPLGESNIFRELRKQGFAHVGIPETQGAFLRLAGAAKRTFTIASPFMNEDGMSWVLKLFKATSAPDRHLIVRSRNHTRDVLISASTELVELSVKVWDYAVSSPDGDGFETFHAKVVLSDEKMAYVGSANMLVHERPSLELGVILEGGPVAEIAALIRAIQRISNRIDVCHS